MRIGYFLSSEEYAPAELIEHAARAERAGFDALWITDHYHPWHAEQGQSPFVWSILGALSQVCALPVTTAVTCPTTRIHPAVLAQAAATAGDLLNGDFVLGVGTGEALNEHVTGARWPSIDVRMEMLEEAVGVMRELWDGGFVTHHGPHCTVENARVYTLPDAPPPCMSPASAASRPSSRAGSATATSARCRTQTCYACSGSPAARTSRRRPATRSAGGSTTTAA